MISWFHPAILVRPRSTPLILKPVFFLPLVLILAGAKYGSMIYMFSSSTAPFMPDGQLMGGDFYVFWTASQALIEGQSLSALYDPEFFSGYIDSIWHDHSDPNAENLRVALGATWQYPPTFGLVIKPLGLLPFSWAYAFWSLLGVLLFLGVLHRSLKLNRVELTFALCCPLIFYAIITGQNGMFTASLLFGAAYFAGFKPVIAGICAGLLMIKPHFGLLLPFVYVSAGYWRTFGVATLTSILFVAISAIFFGFDAWVELPKAILETNNKVSGGEFATPVMRTPYVLGLVLGLSYSAAMSVQIVCSITLIIANCWLWKTNNNRDLKTAFLLGSAILVVPYAFHYDFIFLIPAALLLVRHMQYTIGWVPLFEILCLIAWIYIDQYPILGPEIRITIAIALIVAMLIIIWRVKDFKLPPDKLSMYPALRP